MNTLSSRAPEPLEPLEKLVSVPRNVVRKVDMSLEDFRRLDLCTVWSELTLEIAADGIEAVLEHEGSKIVTRVEIT
jgi:hypothetical protein